MMLMELQILYTSKQDNKCSWNHTVNESQRQAKTGHNIFH